MLDKSQQASLGLRQHLPPAFHRCGCKEHLYQKHLIHYTAELLHISFSSSDPSVRTWYQPLSQGSERQCPGSPVERGNRKSSRNGSGMPCFGFPLAVNDFDSMLWITYVCIYPKKELQHCSICTASFFSTFRCHESLRVTESAGESTAEPSCKTPTNRNHNLPHGHGIDNQGGCQ